MGKRSHKTMPDAGAGPSFRPLPPPGRPWPPWACWVVSGLLLFHITALLTCEIAGQALTSPLLLDLGNRSYGYAVLIHQEIAHAYFAPEPDPATPVVTARLEFPGGKPDRVIRFPDPSTRPRIRYLRQIALGWHLYHEWNQKGPTPRSYWSASFARHLCRANPGCTRVALYLQYHQMPDPGSVVRDIARGEKPVLDSPGLYTTPELIGAFSCNEF